MKRISRHMLSAASVLAVCAGAPGLAQVETGSAARAAEPFEAPPAELEEYVIGPHDLLEIDVFQLDELTSRRRVTGEGTITLPLIGEIAIGGLTPHAAESAIERVLVDRKMVTKPEVSVFVAEYVSSRVSVQGAVKSPGVFDLLGRRTLLEMIGRAGGLDQRAGKRIYVMRPFEDGGEQRIELDADRLVYGADPELNLPLQPGDIVMIPYEQTIRIYVNGQVRSPGAHEFPSDEPVTILQAVTTAGGTTDRANESRVKVIRRFSDGTKQLFEVNLKRIKRGKEEDRLLQRNDIVVVEESFF